MGLAVTALAFVVFAAGAVGAQPNTAPADPPAAAATAPGPGFATGTVFRDDNGNGSLDPDEAGIP